MSAAPARTRHAFAIALVAVAAVWGVTFPVVKDAVQRVPPFEFLALRFTLAAIVMTIVSGWRGPGLDREGHRAGLLAGEMASFGPRRGQARRLVRVGLQVVLKGHPTTSLRSQQG